MNTLFLIAAIYGRLVGGNLVNAPKVVNVDGYWRGTETITEPQANALGYKLVIDERPSCASNEYAVAVGYDYDSATSCIRIRRVYEKRTVEPQPRRWTPRSIKKSALALGYWDSLKSFLVAADAYDDFIMAHYEAEDDEQFVQLMTAARQKFGDAVVDSIINGAEVER